MNFPYSYVKCSCGGEDELSTNKKRLSALEEVLDDKETFNPADPRSNFSLYPLDHLMWCEDCHDIRCPRCTVEEIVCWYCPNCLFETPGGTVRSEGNR